MFAVRTYQQGLQHLLAACDEELVGKRFAEGPFRLDVSEKFYDGLRVEADQLRAMLRVCTIANLVGRNTVDVAVGEGFVDPRNVRTVDGVPHAQYMLLLP